MRFSRIDHRSCGCFCGQDPANGDLRPFVIDRLGGIAQLDFEGDQVLCHIEQERPKRAVIVLPAGVLLFEQCV